MKNSTTSGLAAAIVAWSGTAEAGICDYTPSNILGQTATSVGTALAGSGTAAGLGMQAAGFYTLVHAGSGLTKLGSTAAGASAADTVGIIAGTVGTASAILMAPVAIFVGALTNIGVGSFEGACYFQVEPITDPYDVRRVIESVASQDSTVSIVSTKYGDAMVLNISGEFTSYLLRNLYIADGQLMNRDFGPNKNLGPILYTSEPLEE
tara:strand:+ start:175 stop:798 length:624 start_codon:yes stop_codon:yes gene_type:complete